MDNRKANCLYHTDQLITNFCKDRNCLMPLCPSCIGDHSQYHIQTKTKPQYFNIGQTCSEVQSMLYNVIYALESDRNRNNILMKRIQSIEEVVKEKVLSAKTIVYSLIEQSFEELQANLLGTITKINDDLGLFSLQKAESIDAALEKKLQDLYSLKDGLKSDKFLASIIVFMKQKLQDSSSMHSKLAKYLEANQGYQPKIDISLEAKNAIAHDISRIIKIHSKKQNDRKLETSESRMNIFKNKNNFGERNQKAEKTYTPQKSSVYLKTNIGSSRTTLLMQNNNSPYRERYEPSSSALQLSPNSPYQTPIQQTNRMQSLKLQYQLLTRKAANIRRDNELLTKIK